MVVPIGNRPEDYVIKCQIDHSNEHVSGDEKFRQKTMWCPNNIAFTNDIEGISDVLYWQNESIDDAEDYLDATPYYTEESEQFHLSLSENILI